MWSYIFKRVIRSLFSIFVVTTLIYIIIFSFVPRSYIFRNDPNYNKMAAKPDSKVIYENTVLERMGYINYYNSKELQEKASEVNTTVTTDVNEENKGIYEAYLATLGSGWKLGQLPDSGQFYATREIPNIERVFKFYKNLIKVDHIWRVQDETNPDLERYIKLEKDPSIGWALVGSGTEHKYLLYVNNQFPYIHQNFLTLNLGKSYPTYANQDVLDVIGQGQGKTQVGTVIFPNAGEKQSAVDIYSRTYRSPSKTDAKDKRNYGDDPYTKTQNNYRDPSMIVASSIIGLAGVIIEYLIGVPLGIYMARFKNKWFDKFSTASLTFLMALPSVAFIYVVRFVGGKFGLPATFPALGAHNIKSYILPSLILGLLSMPSLAIWMRRYLIDEQSKDYVSFARAKGLSESEISRRHLLRNAMVPIVSGIPATIVLVITGATLTETVFAYPGMGKMLIDSIGASNNNMVVALTFIFTSLSIFALLLGDILMTVLDPRIRLTSKGGK